eukprot:TRINITY_DN7252_c0_g1_i1.p1 TRINITY_DN7252_c0_g1~~TRINITY_DN7252_c0_g1_i1.p1  ORF type:complete len:597 (+),score=141.67 TRINITY_DN7252_c0_g1_i1:46-1791(+)
MAADGPQNLLDLKEQNNLPTQNLENKIKISNFFCLFSFKEWLFIIGSLSFYFILLTQMLLKAEVYNSGERSFEHLEQGWFMGRKQDLSDSQWRDWRKSFPLLFVILSIFVIISNFIKYIFESVDSLTPVNRRNSQFKARLFYYVFFSIIFIAVLHGSAFLKIFVIIFLNYSIAMFFGDSKLNPIITWIFNAAILFGCNFTHGFPYADFHPVLEQFDKYHGLLHWHTYFKISMLRMISFNLDYYWMLNKKPVAELKISSRTEYRLRQETSLSKEHYCFINYWIYLFYPPLYIAGPIVSYNAFVSQIYECQKTYSITQIMKLLVGVLSYTLIVEILLHFSYGHGWNITKQWLLKEIDSQGKETYIFPGWQAGFLGVQTLDFIFIKFLIIWRFFRVMTLFDGIDSPENMQHCHWRNFNFSTFWRAWHSSFNIWITRYIYVPLGGRSTQHFTVWFIFLFVGLWHDLWWRWVAWALVNCFCFTTEIAIQIYFLSSRMAWLRQKWYWVHLICLAGAINGVNIMYANTTVLHGFETTAIYMKQIFLNFENQGHITILFTLIWGFIHVRSLLIVQEKLNTTGLKIREKV